MAEGGFLLGDGGERAERVGIGIDDAGAVNAERGDARAVGVGRDGGQAQRGAGRIEREHAPVAGRGAGGEGDAQLPSELARIACRP